MNVLQCDQCKATAQVPAGWWALSQLKPATHASGLAALLSGTTGPASVTADLEGTFCSLLCIADNLAARALIQSATPPDS